MGTTVTFGTSGWTGSVRRIGATTLSREALDTTKINQTISGGEILLLKHLPLAARSIQVVLRLRRFLLVLHI